MTVSNTSKPVAAVTANGFRAIADDRLGSAIDADNTEARPIAQVALNIVMDWREDFHKRAARAQLADEIIGLSDERREELLHEGQCLKRVMLALMPERPSA